jgi:hypothetical protein
MTNRFRYIAPPVVEYVPPTGAAASPTMHLLTPAASQPGSRAVSADSFQSILPWFPAPGEQPEGYYHASTQLANGVLSILVDPGAWTNLVGLKVSRLIAAYAIEHGYKPEQWKMEIPLSIMGVGNGSQECKWETKLPICIEDESGTDAELHYFETPTVGGTGEDLPALLGLRSMRSKNAVMEMSPGKEKLSFPGPGGYKIEWSPGTQHFPLTCAPSGHLVIPLGDFKKIKRAAGGVAVEQTTFHARAQDDVNRAVPSSSSSDPLGSNQSD